jgi:hypothetical protein
MLKYYLMGGGVVAAIDGSKTAAPLPRHNGSDLLTSVWMRPDTKAKTKGQKGPLATEGEYPLKASLLLLLSPNNTCHIMSHHSGREFGYSPVARVNVLRKPSAGCVIGRHKLPTPVTNEPSNE